MLRKLLLSCCVSVVALGASIEPVEAKRIGGGKSFGMQRQATPARQATPPAAAPNQAAKPGAPAAAPPKTGFAKWGGMLAGVAAAVGLAALMSHLGIGGEMAGILLAVLAIVVVVMLWRRFMGGRGAQQNTPAYAGAGAPYSQRDQQTPDNNVRPMNFQSADAQGGASAAAGNIPADFDVEAFVRQAKLGFIRLQAANDTGDLADIREFTTPEIFAEIKMSIDERQGATQKTDVILLEAEVLEVAEEDKRYIVSVHFSGQLREEANTAPAAFAEIWHLVKPVDGNRGWMVAGIQQLQ